jgi:hypothetical protein
MVCFRVFLLLFVLFGFSFIPHSSHMSTCRGCLWTAPKTLFLTRPDGFYIADPHLADGGDRYLGVFVKGDRSYFVYTQEHIQVHRIRFGWPLRSITLDVVGAGSEWYLKFEISFWFNLVFLFLTWLILQPIIVPTANLLYGLLNRARLTWRTPR